MSKRKFYAPVPEKVKRATYVEAIRENYSLCDENLKRAWMADDLRKYIPQCYVPEALNFEEEPLRYEEV